MFWEKKQKSQVKEIMDHKRSKFVAQSQDQRHTESFPSVRAESSEQSQIQTPGEKGVLPTERESSSEPSWMQTTGWIYLALGGFIGVGVIVGPPEKDSPPPCEYETLYKANLRDCIKLGVPASVFQVCAKERTEEEVALKRRLNVCY